MEALPHFRAVRVARLFWAPGSVSLLRVPERVRERLVNASECNLSEVLQAIDTAIRQSTPAQFMPDGGVPHEVRQLYLNIYLVARIDGSEHHSALDLAVSNVRECVGSIFVTKDQA